MRKTKIICTLGPASDTEEMVTKLIKAGLNVSRHNFSHGDHPEHKRRIDLVKKLRAKYNKPIAIMLDTKGPEIRTGCFKGGKAEMKAGKDFTVYCGEEVLGDETKCSMSYKDLCKDVKPGAQILIADGLVALEVKSVEGNKIHTVIKNSGVLGDQKNVNVIGAEINLPAINDKDISDIKFGIKEGIDLISASFIRRASDVLAIRKVLEDNGGSNIKIISKIESVEGVQNIDEIIKFTDGVMVARGDLGVEIPTEDVPVVQKMIIKKCNKAGKPVVTATQMLDSMIRNPRPTRAEASDVANAILDGTDAIMLSGESANGDYPYEAVSTMAKIAEKTETIFDYAESLRKKRETTVPTIPNAISLAACEIAMQVKAAAIITVTQSGHTAEMISKYRPQCPIIAVTPHECVERKLAPTWGVYPILMSETESTDELIKKSVDSALEAGYVKKGDVVVIAAGLPANYAGTTNMIKVHIVGDVLVKGKGLGKSTSYGIVSVVKNIKDVKDSLESDTILVVKNPDKKYAELLDRVDGVVSETGTETSDLSVECLKRGIPMIVGAKDATNVLKNGTLVTLDASTGVVYSGKSDVE